MASSAATPDSERARIDATIWFAAGESFQGPLPALPGERK